MATAEEDTRAERFTAGDGVRLCARHWGAPPRPALLLLHGGGANAHWWSPVARRLADVFHLIALDFRGHGDSEHPERQEVGAFQRDVESLAARLGGARHFLVGHSMGAHVALAHAAFHPEVCGVVAIEAGRGASRSERRRTRLALAARRSYRTREEAIERYRFLPAAPGAPESLRRAIAERSVRELPDGRFAYKFDPRWFRIPPAPPPPLGSIACPVLVVRGGESGLLTPDGAAALAAELPQARVLEVPGAGHNVHLEAPDAVAHAIREHVARCVGPA